MDKRPIGYQPGKPYILDKKVPKSNKYDHVESKLAGKTGTTIKDVQVLSKFPELFRYQVNSKEEELTLQKNQTCHFMETHQSIGQGRVHIQLGKA